MRRAFRVAGWVLMLVLAWLVALVALRYFFMSPVQAAGPVQGASFARHLPLLLTHITGGIVALVLGPWQLWGRLRRRFPAVHRWMGRVYLAGIFAGGLAGLGLAAFALGGLPSRTGFGILAVAWLTTGAIALRRIRGGKVRSHREWMIRNYSLTLAAVTLRLWLPLLTSIGLDSILAYQTVAWLSWVPNLVLVELYLRRVRGPRESGRFQTPPVLSPQFD